MNRRGFLTGMAGILAAGYSASVLPSGIIMPIRKLIVPETFNGVIYLSGYIFVQSMDNHMIWTGVNDIHSWETFSLEAA